MNRRVLRETFLSGTAEYDRARPDYPLALRKHAMSGMPRSGLRMLEIGTGSGLATQLFAGATSELVAIDPSEKLLDLAEQRLQQRDIVYRVEAFEDAALQAHHFDIVLAAQSFHWIADAQKGLEKVAMVLRTGGRLVLAWNFVRYEGVDRLRNVREAIVRRVPEYERWPEASDGNLKRYRTEWRDTVRQCASFHSIRHALINRRWRRTPDAFCGWLETLSWFRVLAPRKRHSLIADVRGALEGRPVNVPLETLILLARRR